VLVACLNTEDTSPGPAIHLGDATMDVHKRKYECGKIPRARAICDVGGTVASFLYIKFVGHVLTFNREEAKYNNKLVYLYTK